MNSPTGLLSVSLSALVFAGASAAQRTARVDLGLGGAELVPGAAWPDISGNGRYVAFTTQAANVVPGDTNNESDVFVRDLATGVTLRASITVNGVEANGPSFDPQLSADGRYVAFSSWATNLAASDANGTATDIFVKDMQTGALEHVSVSNAGVGGNGISAYHAISGDGRFVTFYSYASNLVPNDTNGTGQDTFLFDRATRRIECLSVDPVTGGTVFGGTAALSHDGRIVAFETLPQVVGQTGGSMTIAVLDRQTGALQPANVNALGEIRHATGPHVSSDGSRVLFQTSFALSSSDLDYARDGYCFEVVTGAITLVTPSPPNTVSAHAANAISLSADGRYVLFNTREVHDLPDNNGEYDLFVHDVATGTVSRVSVGDNGQTGDDRSASGMLSANGARCVFSSVATNLVPSDTNGALDVFLRDRCSPASWRNYGQGLAGAGGLVPGFVLLGDPVLGTAPLMVAANHTGAPALGLIVLGTQATSLPTPALGTLLVQPLVAASLTMPSPVLTLPLAIPPAFDLCGVGLRLQVLVLDGAAPRGVAFTRGLEVTIGG